MAVPDRVIVRVIVTCEHGGNSVPPAYANLFVDHAELLPTHRGWDPGAADLGREMAEALGAAFFVGSVTRLLIDLNRSIGHRQLHSEATRGLSRSERREIAKLHYHPHRDAVESAVDASIARGERVIHIASHSFTPELRGVVRQADVSWLYDPRRAGEQNFSTRWRDALRTLRPDLRLRRNYPYEGKSDGLATLLRKRYSADDYIGVELEVNQQFVFEDGPAWPALRAAVIESLRMALGESIA
jgi:predicted N-formylglutamate amidohydrolase